MDKYTIDKMIGSGAQARAYLAHRANDTSQQVVLKRFPVDSVNNQEMGILLRLKHNAIIRCYEAFTHDDDLFLVLQYADGGDLERVLASAEKRHLGPREVLPWPTVDRFFIQLALGLQHCHDNRTLHRDIKTGNVFVTKDMKNAMLGDFGVAKVLGNDAKVATTMIGTPLCLSPEVVSGGGFGYPSDVWALGCVLYEMLTLKKPFPYSNIATLVTKIAAGEYDPLPSSIPGHYRRILKGMLQVDPNRRYSIQEALGELPRKMVLTIQQEWAPPPPPPPPPPPQPPVVAAPAIPAAKAQPAPAPVAVAPKPDQRAAEVRGVATGPLSDWVKWKNREFDEIEAYLAQYRDDDAQPTRAALPGEASPPAKTADHDDDPVTPLRAPGLPRSPPDLAAGQLNANRARRMLPSPQVLNKQQHGGGAVDDVAVRPLQVASPQADEETKQQREARRAEQRADLQRLMAQGRQEVRKSEERVDVAVQPKPSAVLPAPPAQAAAKPSPQVQQGATPASNNVSPPPPPLVAPSAAPSNHVVGGAPPAPGRVGVRDMIREQRQQAMAGGRGAAGGNFDVQIKLPSNLQHLLQ